jgi:hypothetical protein
MEDRLEKGLLKYNSLQTQNKLLRSQIDVMRKEQRNQLRVNGVL